MSRWIDRAQEFREYGQPEDAVSLLMEFAQEIERLRGLLREIAGIAHDSQLMRPQTPGQQPGVHVLVLIRKMTLPFWDRAADQPSADDKET